MSESILLDVKDDGQINFPTDVADSYNLKKGQKLLVIKKEGALEIITEQSQLWERFHTLLKDIRHSVKEAGGISENKIDRKLKEIRKGRC
ncbi:MAG: hypothetical protein ACE5OR_12775 [bacterium]